MFAVGRYFDAVVVCGLSVLLVGSAHSAKNSKTINATNTRVVEIITCSGKVSVSGTASDTINIQWSDNPQPKMETDDHLLRVVNVEAENDDCPEWPRRDPDLSLSIPPGVEVAVRTVSGNTEVNGVQAEARIQTVSGSASVNDAESVQVSSVSGGVELRAISSAATVKTVSGSTSIHRSELQRAILQAVSGDIEIKSTRVRDLQAQTQSGDVHFAGDLDNEGNIEINGFSGDVQLDLPPEASFTLRASTHSGDIEIEPSIEYSERSSHLVRGRSGSGNVDLRLSTFSGDVQVSTRD